MDRMSESTPTQDVSAARPRYQRSNGGLLGAMIVTVVAVLAFAGIRALTSRNDETPVRSVDYTAMLRAGRAEHKLLMWAPSTLPTGWRATSASYSTGVSPSWHLGLLTDGSKYVGVEEARLSVEELVKDKVDKDAEQGPDVTIDGKTWQSWTDPQGDYAVSRSLKVNGTPEESWLVVGSAPDAEIREFAGTLTSGTLTPPTP